MTVRFTAAAVCLVIGAALMPPAHAQDRDLKTWGGPPNLGIDFKTGNSYGVSDFGAANPAAEPKRRVTRSRGGRKSNPTETARGTLKNPPLPQPNPARLAADPSSTLPQPRPAPPPTPRPSKPAPRRTPQPRPHPLPQIRPHDRQNDEVGVGRMRSAVTTARSASSRFRSSRRPVTSTCRGRAIRRTARYREHVSTSERLERSQQLLKLLSIADKERHTRDIEADTTHTHSA